MGVLTLDEIVTGGLCIGCGLCKSVAGPDKIRMVLTAQGRERPVAVRPLGDDLLAVINDICPGTRIDGVPPEWLTPTTKLDAIWGPVISDTLFIAHATDPQTRFRAAAGGVLTALGQHLLRSGAVDRVLHVRASDESALRSIAIVSETPEDVLEGAASRYGPAPVLETLCEILALDIPIAIVAKPCDIGAVRRLATVDARVGRLVKYCLALVCGGASDLIKTLDVLERFGLQESEVRRFSYRGHGNPGPTRVETIDGRSFELTYNDMWGDESAWRLQPRCKICPDAIGETADLVVADCWPGGAPGGEDEGYNAVFARTRTGAALLQQAIADGDLTAVRPADIREMDEFQPHQVRKKRAVWPRLMGMRAAGMAIPDVRHLRIEELAAGNDEHINRKEQEGAERRVTEGRLGEPPAESAG